MERSMLDPSPWHSALFHAAAAVSTSVAAAHGLDWLSAANDIAKLVASCVGIVTGLLSIIYMIRNRGRK